MNSSGDAAEQIVRMSLEGVEIAAKITGSAAKNVAAMLYAILKNRNPQMAKGRKRLARMLKIDKPITVFTTSAENAKAFHHGSKEYGFPYYPIPNKKKFNDGQMDFLVFKDDANKINRIIAVFKTVAYSSGGFFYNNFINAADENEFNEYVARCKALSFYDTSLSADYGNKLITLSTCEYSNQNGRLVVVARKITN